MKKLRIYLDTSVIGGCFDHEFSPWSNALLDDFIEGSFATVAEVDVLVSWNFKHIVRLDKIRLFNAVNLELGYKVLQIYSPREVTLHGRDRDQGS